jgi:hypothetical protein
MQNETKVDEEPTLLRFQGSYGEYYSYNDIDYDTINKLFAKKDIERINSLIGSQIWDLKQAKLWTIKD